MPTPDEVVRYQRLLHRLYTGGPLSQIERRTLAAILLDRLHEPATDTPRQRHEAHAPYRNADERGQAEELERSNNPPGE